MKSKRFTNVLLTSLVLVLMSCAGGKNGATGLTGTVNGLVGNSTPAPEGYQPTNCYKKIAEASAENCPAGDVCLVSPKYQATANCEFDLEVSVATSDFRAIAEYKLEVDVKGAEVVNKGDAALTDADSDTYLTRHAIQKGGKNVVKNTLVQADADFATIALDDIKKDPTTGGKYGGGAGNNPQNGPPPPAIVFENGAPLFDIKIKTSDSAPSIQATTKAAYVKFTRSDDAKKVLTESNIKDLLGDSVEIVDSIK